MIDSEFTPAPAARYAFMIHFLPVEWHDSLPSTNTCLVDRARKAPETPHGTVVAARFQSSGRGRQQRQWVAPPNENITVSFLWNAPLPTAFVPSLAQAISLGVCRAIQAHVRPSIKWPNDVLVDNRKICGILCEHVGKNDRGNTVIVAGIGLNVNLGKDAAESVDQPVTSLFLETGYQFGIDEVLAGLLDSLVPPLTAWGQKGFPGIRDEYACLGATRRTTLRVRDGDRHVSGLFTGYTDAGGLVLELDSGAERVFYSGDVSIVPHAISPLICKEKRP